jgi:hypothetical protein
VFHDGERCDGFKVGAQAEVTYEGIELRLQQRVRRPVHLQLVLQFAVLLLHERQLICELADLRREDALAEGQAVLRLHRPSPLFVEGCFLCRQRRFQ